MISKLLIKSEEMNIKKDERWAVLFCFFYRDYDLHVLNNIVILFKKYFFLWSFVITRLAAASEKTFFGR